MRRVGQLLAAVMLSAAIAGCAVPHRIEVGTVDKSAVTPQEVDRIFEQYRTTRNAAAELLDPKPLSTVETGPVLDIDTGSFEISQRLKQTEKTRTGPIDVTRVETPRFTRYPLWFFAVVQDADSELQRLQIFQRESAVDPWLLVATPEALATTPIPAVRHGAHGGAVVVKPDDGRGIAMSPKEAADAYARTLADPDAPEASTITNDAFVQQMRKAAASNADVRGAEFSQSWSVESVDHVLRTEAGGALAFVTLVRTDTYRVDPGRRITWPAGSPQEALLSGGIQGGSGSLEYNHQLVVHLPPGTAKPRTIAQYGGVVRGTGADTATGG